MFFVVTGQSARGEEAITCDAPAKAYERAIDLVSLGASDVSIVDSEGRRHDPAEFRRAFIEQSLAQATSDPPPATR